MIELYALEVDVLAFALKSPRALGSVIENLGRDYRFVTDPHNWIFDKLREAYEAKGEVPSPAVLLHQAGEDKNIKSSVEKLQEHQPSSPAMAIEELRKVAMLGKIRLATDEARQKLKTQDPVAAREILSRLVLSTDRREGAQVIDFYEGFEGRQEVRRKANTPASVRIKLLIKPIDEAVSGLVPGDLFLIVGTTNIGKTYFTSSHITFSAITQGWGGIYFSLEDSAQSIANRIDARLFKIPKPKISIHDLTDEEVEQMRRTLARRKELEGKLQIIGMPAGACGIETIKRAIVERRAQGRLVDFIVVDSPDHMPPIRKREQVRFEIKETFQALKDLAVEFNIPVIATTHMPQAFEGKVAAKTGVTAESYDKMRIASKAVTLNHTEEMLPDEVLLVLVKNRDGRKGVKVSMVVDYDTGNYRVLRKPEDYEDYEAD